MKEEGRKIQERGMGMGIGIGFDLMICWLDLT
jgi:hypothetical protein